MQITHMLTFNSHPCGSSIPPSGRVARALNWNCRVPYPRVFRGWVLSVDRSNCERTSSAEKLRDAILLAETVVPGGRVELPTPAFSGPRSTGELPRHRSREKIVRAGKTRSKRSEVGVLACFRSEDLSKLGPRLVVLRPRWPRFSCRAPVCGKSIPSLDPA